MDSHGWVPLALVSSFKRLCALTGGSMPLLRDAVRHSEVLETNGDRIRLRDGAWEPWVLRDAVQSSVSEEQPAHNLDGTSLPSYMTNSEQDERRVQEAEDEDEDDDGEEEEESDDDIVIVMSIDDL
jgi:hypothetical protein